MAQRRKRFAQVTVVICIIASASIVRAIDDEFAGYIHLIKNKNLNDNAPPNWPVTDQACQAECDVRDDCTTVLRNGVREIQTYPDDSSVYIYVKNSTRGGGVSPTFVSGGCNAL